MIFAMLALGATAVAPPSSAAIPVPPAAAFAQPAPAKIDPARLAIARRLVAKVLVSGRFAEIMMLLMTKLLEGMDAQKNRVEVIKILPLMNAPLDTVNRISPENINKIAAVLDPAADQRDAIIKRIVVERGRAIGTRYEPDMREAMAVAYARNFDAKVLADVERFFSTPSGATYAAASMALSNDPALTELNTRIQADVGQQTAALMKEVIAQIAGLPPPRTFGELNQAERFRIAELAGIKSER